MVRCFYKFPSEAFFVSFRSIFFSSLRKKHFPNRRKDISSMLDDI